MNDLIETSNVETDDQGREFVTERRRVSTDEVRRGDFLDLPGNGFVVENIDMKTKYVTFYGPHDRKARMEIEGPQLTIVRKVETKASSAKRILMQMINDLPGEIESAKQAAVAATAKVAENTAKGYALSWSDTTAMFETTARWEAVYAPLQSTLQSALKIDDDNESIAEVVDRYASDDKDVLAAIVEAARYVVDRMKSDLLEYRLGGSTNPVSNLIDDAHRAAKAEALRSGGSLLMRIVVAADEAGV